VNTARRDRWLVAAGVVLMLVALVVVGRLQGRKLPEGDAAVSQPTTSTVRIDAAPVASGLAVAGRVALPGPAAAVAVGEDAIWGLDQRTGKVTVTAPLPDLALGLAAGPVLGGGAVWLAGPSTRLQDGGGILLRVDPASGRVTGWLRSPLGFAQDVLAAGPHGAWVGTAVPELLHLVPA
jgi:hypothetical protein